MFKKLVITLVCLMPLLSLQAADFKEGTHFVEIDGEVTKKREVTEFFSFYCPACFRQEPFMNDLKISLPAGVTFKKNHVDGMPGRDLAIEQLLTKALIAAKYLKIDDKVVPALFNTIHVDKSSFTTIDEIKRVFVSNGIDGKKFDNVFESFGVNAQAKKMQKNTQNIRNQGFTAVPTLVINGKYLPLTKNLTSLDEYKALVLFLLDKA